MAATRIYGKVVVITGPTAGIGKAAALELARRGATLGLVARNPQKAERIAAEPDLTHVTGRFFSSTRGAGFLPAAPARRDRAIAARVYERSRVLVGLVR
jgi:NAD(P)-dependent dehydrogenase (short-subunit alcohol dehydrogenase family)